MAPLLMYTLAVNGTPWSVGDCGHNIWLKNG